MAAAGAVFRFESRNGSSGEGAADQSFAFETEVFL